MELWDNKVLGQQNYKSHCNYGLCPPKGLCGTSVSAQDFLLPDLSFSWRESCLRCGEYTLDVFHCLRMLNSTPPLLETSKTSTRKVSTYFTALPPLLQRFHYSYRALIHTELGRQHMGAEGLMWVFQLLQPLSYRDIFCGPSVSC